MLFRKRIGNQLHFILLFFVQYDKSFYCLDSMSWDALFSIIYVENTMDRRCVGWTHEYHFNISFGPEICLGLLTATIYIVAMETMD